MATLMDTNILLRLVDPNDREYTLVREAVRALASRGESLCFAGQNLVEFWNVCTRPASKNGLGLTAAQTDERASLIEVRFRLCLMMSGFMRSGVVWSCDTRWPEFRCMMRGSLLPC